jgi:hypothetical protein
MTTFFCERCGNGFGGDSWIDYLDPRHSDRCIEVCRACYAARNWPAVPEVQWRPYRDEWVFRVRGQLRGATAAGGGAR